MANKLKKYIITSLMSICVGVSLFSNTVYAERSDIDSISYVGENHAEIVAICAKANNIANTDVLVYTGNDGLLSFSNTKYSKLTVDERRDFMETALLSTKESGLGSQVKNKVYNFIAKQDTSSSSAVKFLRSDASADFATAASYFKPFGSVFGVALGMLSLFIFMFIGLSILIDMAYMVIPGVRMFIEGGTKGKPKWVSKEAFSAVVESEEALAGQSYKGYMSLYFKRRVPSIIGMSVTLGYLISNQIYSIIVYIIDSFAWIFSR